MIKDCLSNCHGKYGIGINFASIMCIREDRCSLYLALSVDLLWYLLCGGEHFESITLLGEAITLLWK